MLYNSLPHIRDAQHTPMPKAGTLLDLIKKYELGSVIGVARLHKHFQLMSDEYVVWTTKPEFRSEVRKVKGSPMCFACINGKWIQTEYYDGPDIYSELIKKEEFKEFLQEFKKLIEGYQNIYGLILRLTDGNDMEETDAPNRTQKIQPKKEIEYKGEVITKFWADGPIGECTGHVGSCYSYCSRNYV